MILGVYNAVLHDRPLEDALKVIGDLGLNGIEINSGGFLPPTHIPNIDEIVASPAAAKAYLAKFEGTGVQIAGLNCNGNPLHPNPVIGDKHAEDVRRSIRAAATGSRAKSATPLVSRSSRWTAMSPGAPSRSRSMCSRQKRRLARVPCMGRNAGLSTATRPSAS